MKQFVLKNDVLTVVINEKGAEISSVVRDGVDYMWYADSKYWGLTAPVLFPIVGMLKDKTYRHNGKTYTMGQHGLARDCMFTCLSKVEAVAGEADRYLICGDEAWFSLEDSEETFKNYPFHFILEIGYRLRGAQIEVMWRVTKPTSEYLLSRKKAALPSGGSMPSEEKELLFSIGGHPAFLCPWNVDSANTDEDVISEGMQEAFRQEGYALRLMKKGKPVLNFVSKELEGPLLSNKEKVFLTKNGILPITEHLFDGDALVLENEQVDEVSLIDPNGAEYIKVGFGGPLMGIWSPLKKNAPFVCIEPWYGRCDRADFDGELSEREYGHRLAAGEKFEGGFKVEFGK